MLIYVDDYVNEIVLNDSAPHIPEVLPIVEALLNPACLHQDVKVEALKYLYFLFDEKFDITVFLPNLAPRIIHCMG